MILWTQISKLSVQIPAMDLESKTGKFKSFMMLVEEGGGGDFFPNVFRI